MTEQEIVKIVYSNPTNKYIYEHLDDKTADLVLQVLEKLDAKEFKEINKDAQFDFTDIPIPYANLTRRKEVKNPTFSKKINETMSELLTSINEEGTNYETAYAFAARKRRKNTYNAKKQMGKGERQTCSYDWKWIEEYIKNCEDNINFSLFHTHPNELGVDRPTLYNAHKDLFKEMGIQPNGLNLSVADIYATMYLDMLCKKYHKNLTIQSHVLMHDGNLLTFSTQNNGVVLDAIQSIHQKEKTVSEGITV